MTKDQSDTLYAMRHSMAHILASAIKRLYPDAKFGVGPVVENGFYYDLDLESAHLSEEEFSKIETEMKRIIKDDQKFNRSTKSIDEALEWAQSNHQPYKEELLNDLKRDGTTAAKDINADELGVDTDNASKVDSVSFYQNGDFIDLCRGPHVESTSKVGAFKLMRVSGAYWRGKEDNPQMQRVYGVAFETKEELDDYLRKYEEAKKRDHRKLGKELDLFVISDLVGSGLPLLTPRGTVLRKELIGYSEELQKAKGYLEVWAPHMTRSELYKISGHYDKYPERFDVTSIESDDKFMLKPMNCPHVIQIYASRPRSYKELPIRYMQTTTMYRDEKSGELHGLSRVRSITQDDAHAFVTVEQIEAEMYSIVQMVKDMYKALDMPLNVDLSFRDDEDKYLGDKSVWDKAQKIIEKVAKEEKLDYKVAIGEAAFYGPKIDIYVEDSLNRRWQCATIQVDFVMPERFGLEYTDKDSKKQMPVMVHKALLGSIERFLSVYIEHTAGRFPIWLAPEQLRIITLNQTDEIVNYAETILEKAKQLKIRASVDNDNQSVGKKIREAEMLKIPYVIVIGNKEVESKEVKPRIRSDLASNEEAVAISVEDFLSTISREHSTRSAKSTL